MRIRAVFFVAFLPLFGFAQHTQEEFEKRAAVYEKEFQSYIDKYDKEFVTLLKTKWVECDIQKPTYRKVKLEPKKPVYFSADSAAVKPLNRVVEIDSNRVIEGKAYQQAKGAKTHTVVQNVLDSELSAKLKSPNRIPTSNEVDKAPAVVKEQVPTPPVSVEKEVPSLPDLDIVERVSTPAEQEKPISPPVQVVQKTVVPLPATPTPVVPVTEKEVTIPTATSAATGTVSVLFYGNTFSFENTLRHCFSLSSIQEKEVATAWQKLANLRYSPIIEACQKIKLQLSLGDWGMVKLTEKIAHSFYTDASEQVVLQSFLLAQCGYNVKIARAGQQLALLVATDSMLYGYPYFSYAGCRYFLLKKGVKKSVYTYKSNFAKAVRLVKMGMDKAPRFKGKEVERRYSSARPTINVRSKVSQELIRFYKDYPQCEFPVYMHAPVSTDFLQTVLPVLKMSIIGKTQQVAAGILLRFVQTGFDYKTDDDQFGYEKPFFVDESFYYPYCDCEDRAILFSFLIRTLLGLEVVLVDYPNHMATAVLFPKGDVKGDSLLYKGNKYVICDPTYINAPVGKSMPKLRDSSLKIINF
ncbi:MAG: hypothetical protein PHY71_02565 [Bacteroidaceae bacterium]|nr:hypothetical protein [Bacteroidaceae bacterium]